jgi:hypothetical protein
MKLLPTQVVADQLRTFRDTRSTSKRQIAPWDFVWFYAVPVAIGVVAWAFGVKNLETGALLTAVAVLTGLIFNLSFSVFDKSLQIRNDPLLGDPITIMLVEELRINVNYTVLVGIVLTGILSSASLFVYDPLASATCGLIAAGMAHLLLMCGMILKRFNALHNAMKP